MLYLYAFVREPARLPDTTGVGGAPATLVPLGAVAAVAAEVEGALEPTDENVLSHARVVDALAAVNDAVLPVRFGRGFRDREDLESAAARLGDDLESRLDEVSGCVEVGLHVAGPAQPALSAGSGRDYMQQRLRDVARAEALAADIHAPLAERARAATRSRSVGTTALLRAAYLVPRAEVETFRTAVDEAQRRYGDLSFACTGPWPPYSFAVLEREGATA
jgi:Gas vesicle synthesis protein GvpL/GvpF